MNKEILNTREDEDENDWVTEIYIECTSCDYCTDISVFSETNPNSCPKCGGQLVDGNGDEWPEEIV